MRIAQVCVRFGAPGGAEAHVRALATHLARRGHEVVVYTSDLYTEKPWARGGAFEAPPEGVEVVRLPMKRLPGPVSGIHLEGLGKALRESRADIFHGHSHRYWHLRTMAGAARATSRPWCVTPHYHPIEEGEPRWKHWGARLLDAYDARAVYAGASRVFTVTDLEKRHMRGLAPARAMLTIPNGLDVARWDEAAPPFDPTGRGRPYALYAGRLASNKGLDTLLRAWARLAPKHARTDLVLLGRDWGMEGALRALAKELGIAERVHVLGHVDDARYQAAIQGCRLFVLPSEWEAFGIVLLEAMASRRPVVATRVGGVPEVVADGVDGALVPYRDDAALADAMDRILSDDALARHMGDAGREKAERHDWAAIVARLDAEYRNILEEA